MNNKNDIQFVKENYKYVAKQYRENKDSTQSEIPVFRKWLEIVSKVLELGCGAGFPIAKTILDKNIDYTGIDLSPDQIQIAKNEFKQWNDKFIEAEMLSFVKSQPDDYYDGVVSMFSIRHLPRRHHVELLENVKRILKSGGLLLVDHPRYSEDARGTWFEDKPMYWSSFSEEWQRLTMKELGFISIDEFEDVKLFNGEEERTLFVIYQV